MGVTGILRADKALKGRVENQMGEKAISAVIQLRQGARIKFAHLLMISSQDFVVNQQIDPVVQKQTLLAVAAKYEADDIGVLYQKNDGYMLSEMLKDFEFEKTGEFFLANYDGVMVGGENEEYVRNSSDYIEESEKNGDKDFAKVLEKSLEKGKDSGYEITEINGKKKCLAYADLPDYG